MFVQGFSSIAFPLTTLTQKKAKIIWFRLCEKSFQELKNRITSIPVLTLPEGINGFVAYCAASKIGLGCVLMQKDKVIAYASRKHKVLEKNYPTTRAYNMCLITKVLILTKEGGLILRYECSLSPW